MKHDDYLETLLEEHSVLLRSEARLAERAALCSNAKWRIKFSTDRKLISRRLERCNREIMAILKLRQPQQSEAVTA